MVTPGQSHREVLFVRDGVGPEKHQGNDDERTDQQLGQIQSAKGNGKSHHSRKHNRDNRWEQAKALARWFRICAGSFAADVGVLTCFSNLPPEGSFEDRGHIVVVFLLQI